MSRCTAPVRGHRTASAAAACPACSSRSRGYNYYNYSPPTYSHSAGSGSSGRAPRNQKPSWSPQSSPLLYTASEVRALTPIRKSIEKRATIPDLRDVFLCHAWDDRNGIAKELHDRLEAEGISVWFSEKDVRLGTPLLREIDKGLAMSKAGIVLVTPAFLTRLSNEGIAAKELSALLATDLLVPVVHNTTYEALRNQSPLLGSRSGLTTNEDTIDRVTKRLAELVRVVKIEAC